jgi:hypothetical protein
MRVLVLHAFFAALLGCPERKAEPTLSPAPSEAPMDLDKPAQARVQLDLANARAGVLQRQQIEGSYPQSLDQLGIKFFHPEDLIYDATTGTVHSRTYPSL